MTRSSVALVSEPPTFAFGQGPWQASQAPKRPNFPGVPTSLLNNGPQSVSVHQDAASAPNRETPSTVKVGWADAARCYLIAWALLRHDTSRPFSHQKPCIFNLGPVPASREF